MSQPLKKKGQAQYLRAFGKHLALTIERRGYCSPYDFWIRKAGDHLSRASINFLVLGKKDPKLSTIRILARLLNVSPKDLLDFEK